MRELRPGIPYMIVRSHDDSIVIVLQNLVSFRASILGPNETTFDFVDGSTVQSTEPFLTILDRWIAIMGDN